MDMTVKCLLVDDLEENLFALAALLRTEGLEILKAQSGTEALELLLAHDIALAFVDVQMPGMDGFELAELMRGSTRTRSIPIIFLTAGTHDQSRVFKGYESGAVDFIHKPIDANVLRNKAMVFFQLYRQRVQLAAQLAERTEALRMNEMFMAVLGHDLRNPLHAILNSAMLLQRRSQDEASKRAVGWMLTSCNRMSRMIEDVLDMARVRSGGGIPVMRSAEALDELIGPLLIEYQATYPGREVVVRTSGDLSGQWDKGRIAQVAGNLIGNALQHGEPTEPVIVEIEGVDAAVVTLKVCNKGSIPVPRRQVIFDPFRGRDHTQPQGGLGLGLYIVDQIVQAHGGRVHLDASTSTHTVFSVELPRNAPEQPAATGSGHPRRIAG